MFGTPAGRNHLFAADQAVPSTTFSSTGVRPSTPRQNVAPDVDEPLAIAGFAGSRRTASGLSVGGFAGASSAISTDAGASTDAGGPSRTRTCAHGAGSMRSGGGSRKGMTTAIG